MKQRIIHGAEIDAATPTEIATLIAGAFDANRHETYRREKGVINLDGTGAGVATIKTTRLYDWVLERVTITAGPNAIIQLFSNQQAPSDLLEVIGLGAAGLYSDSFANKIFVEAGSQLIIAVSAGGANGQATFNLQTKLIRVVK